MSRKPSNSRKSENAKPIPDTNTNAAQSASREIVDWRAWFCLVCGWIVPQIFLIGPALIGQMNVVPLDLLSLPEYYMSRADAAKAQPPVDQVLLDLVEVDGPARDFCAHEFRHGRLPLWQPDNFAGAPFATWPKYSPFEIPYWVYPHPPAVAWNRLLQVLCFASGGWWFLWRVIGVSFWSAAVGSWLLPLIGFITLWNGYSLTGSIVWFPWLLVAVHRTVQNPVSFGVAGVAISTALTLLSGQPDVGALALLGTGFYAVNRLWTEHRFVLRKLCLAGALLTFGWTMGFLLAAPYWMPLIDYAKTGARFKDRLQGAEERPPEGVATLVATLVPDAFGDSRRGSIYLGPTNNFLESSAGAFAGLLATLWLAPLALSDRSRRSQIRFWIFLAIFGVAWAVGIPGVVQIMRLPGFNSLSYSRAVFLTAFAIITLAAIGLDQIQKASLKTRIWPQLAIGVAAISSVIFLWLAIELPEPLNTILPDAVRTGRSNFSREEVKNIQQSFSLCYARTAILFGFVAFAWSWTLRARTLKPLGFWLVVALLLADPFWLALRHSRLRSWQPGYPQVTALKQLSEMPLGRIWGLGCLPPNLNRTQGLADIRGYDGIDPQSIVEVIKIAGDPRVPPKKSGKTRSLIPAIYDTAGRKHLHPVADMLNVRYLLGRNAQSHELPLVLQQDDYWIYENPNVLPRAFVPTRVEKIDNAEQTITFLSRLDFRPAEIACVPIDLDLPNSCHGQVTQSRIEAGIFELEAQMDTAGLVVVSELFTPDWRATIDGQPAQIVRANHALLGVSLPSGIHTIRFEYHSAAVRSGFKAAIVGVILLGITVAAIAFLRFRNRPAPLEPVSA